MSVERVVDVAFVVVPFCAVKFWSVEEPLTKRLVAVWKTEVINPMTPVLALKSVVEALPET